MKKYPVFVLLMLLTGGPAFGKGKKDIYPISCGVLWSAVRETLGNAGNYTIMAMDDSEMTASFTIVGATRVRVNSVALNVVGPGCDLQVHSGESGFANDDTGAFKKRVSQSLAKLKTAVPAGATPKPSGGN
jgi:hypothetical protein